MGHHCTQRNLRFAIDDFSFREPRLDGHEYRAPEDSVTGPSKGQFAASDGLSIREAKRKFQTPPNSLQGALDSLRGNQWLSSTAIERVLKYCTLPHIRCLDYTHSDSNNLGLIYGKPHAARRNYWPPHSAIESY